MVPTESCYTNYLRSIVKPLKKNRFRFSKLWISLNLRDLLSSWVLKIICLVLKIGSNNTSELSRMYLNVYVKKPHNQYSWKFRAVVFRTKIKKLYCLFLWMGCNCLKAKAISRRQFTFFHQVPTKSLKLFTTKFLVLILSTSEGWMTESTLEPPSGFKHGVHGLGIQHLNSFMTEAVIIYSLLCKSMDWFLYDNSPRHERVNR